MGKADAIIVLSGDWNFERENGSIELYKKGAARRIIRVLEKENIPFEMLKKLLSTSATQKDLYLSYFESRGVNGEAVILGEEAATSTFDELKCARRLVQENHFGSVILVTSDYHMRRALITARWLFKGTGIKILHTTIYSKDFNPSKWWLHERSIKEVIIEYLSLFFYIFYHFMLGK